MSVLRIRQTGIDFSDDSRMTSLYDIIPQNSRMIFSATAAPTRWTRVTTANYTNTALRLITQGTPTLSQSSGNRFTQAFVNDQKSFNSTGTIQSIQVGNHTLTTAQIPSHSHPYGRAGAATPSSIATPSNQGSAAGNTAGNTGNAGSGGQHAHPVSFGNVVSPIVFSVNTAVRYCDVILCSYNGRTQGSPVADTGT